MFKFQGLQSVGPRAQYSLTGKDSDQGCAVLAEVSWKSGTGNGIWISEHLFWASFWPCTIQKRCSEM